MKKVLSWGLLAALLLPVSAFAGSLTLNWINPTQYVDGTPLPASALTANRTIWGTCNGTAFGTKIGEHKLGVVTTDKIDSLPPGTYCVQVFASAGAAGESDGTNVVSATINPPKPGKPGNVTVTVTVTVDTGTQ